MKKRTKADRRRAALKGWRTRRKNEELRLHKKSSKPTRSSISKRIPARTRRRTKDFQRRSQAAKKGWRTRRRNQKKLQQQTKTRQEVFQPKREYFVVLIFQTRKQSRTVTRRLYEAIVTLHDGASEDEILEAYQEKVQQEHPKLHNAEIERLLFGPNRGRTINIVPRDTIGSDFPSGNVQVNDARKSAKKKRKGKA